ncbi:M1 family metallopeptidase [Streptomyces sp. A5-4]|uniref:M1 family metallopeptidase n=1 Tax=Streptomyces sp. A5-4 TaxID=3384771 RepID=UPI003DA8CD58
MDQWTLVRRTAPAAAVALLLLTSCTSGGVSGEPGASGVRDPYFPKLGNGGYDVEHYGLTLDYDPKSGRLRGTAEITARATQDLSAFNLDFHGMRVDAARVEGEKAAVSRAGDELTLRPAADLNDGETFHTVVRYSGEPATITDDDESEEGWLPTEDGALALGEPTGSMAWFPGNNHPRDKASYDITVTVPKGLKAVSNGELKSERTRGDRTTFHWNSAEPMASYLATVAIGKYRTKTARTKSGLPVLTAVDPTVAKDSAKVLARIPEIVEWGTENFGPYPFSSAGAIVEREDDAGYALETQTKPVFPGAPDEGTLVHELAHQWFGDSVTPRTWKDMWLNEGFASYAEWLWEEDMYEGGSTDESFKKAFDDKANWAFPPADPPTAADISSAPVYGRGAMVIHKIRAAVGDDAFYDIVRGWVATHRHGNASTDDFTAYVEKKSGKDLTGLWDTWLYGQDKPASP